MSRNSIIIAESSTNVVEMFATSIQIQWDFRNNTGPVKFMFERVDWNPETKMLNERTYDSTLGADIGTFLGKSYIVESPIDGSEIEVPGWLLMGAIKAATKDVWDSVHNPPNPPVELPPEEQPEPAEDTPQ